MTCSVPAPENLPRAGVRTHVLLPLVLPDGDETTADVWTFTGLLDGLEHVAIGLGDWRRADPPLVRPHSECLTGDVLGSARCDCGRQLQESLARIVTVGGFLLYLRQEGRGIGLYNKLDAYAVQDTGVDTFAANRLLGFSDDERNYGVAAQMLLALGVDRLDLLTNNPDKIRQLRGAGLSIGQVHPTARYTTEHNAAYLSAKVSHTGHSLPEPEARLLCWPLSAGGPV
jgi:GTP cyclohydrolase II